MNVPTCYNLKNRKLKKTAMDSIRERLDFENTYVQEFLHVFNKGLGARIFEFYTNSVLYKKDLIYLHSVQTLRKQFSCFPQTCEAIIKLQLW